jgi:hypothetical protein
MLCDTWKWKLTCGIEGRKIHRDRRMVITRSWDKGKMGSCCLIDTEL